MCYLSHCASPDEPKVRTNPHGRTSGKGFWATSTARGLAPGRIRSVHPWCLWNCPASPGTRRLLRAQALEVPFRGHLAGLPHSRSCERRARQVGARGVPGASNMYTDAGERHYLLLNPLALPPCLCLCRHVWLLVREQVGMGSCRRKRRPTLAQRLQGVHHESRRSAAPAAPAAARCCNRSGCACAALNVSKTPCSELPSLPRPRRSCSVRAAAASHRRGRRSSISICQCRRRFRYPGVRSAPTLPGSAPFLLPARTHASTSTLTLGHYTPEPLPALPTTPVRQETE